MCVSVDPHTLTKHTPLLVSESSFWQQLDNYPQPPNIMIITHNPPIGVQWGGKLLQTNNKQVNSDPSVRFSYSTYKTFTAHL